MSADIHTGAALAWAKYTAYMAEKGINPEQFTDSEKIAFQSGYAAGVNAGMDRAIQIHDEMHGSKA